jgi:hypothetical protein
MDLLSIFNSFYTAHIDKKPGARHTHGYQTSGNKVFYHPGMGGGPAFEVVGADLRSFENSRKAFADARYGRDKNQVYFNGRVVRGADPESFSRMQRGYIRDVRSVYYNGSFLSNDADHFQFIDEFVQKDRTHVYRGGWIISDDPENFEFIAKIDGLSYYRDQKGVLANSTRLPGAHAATFTPLRHGYSRDARQVYKVDGMLAKVILGACPTEFDVFNAYYTHDEKSVYWQGKPLPGADPATFAMLEKEFRREKISA